MGKYTDEVATRDCSICKRKTFHQIIIEKKVSGAKILGGFLTSGLSLLATGVKSNQESYMCHECKTINP
jgi:hypothetical protein